MTVVSSRVSRKVALAFMLGAAAVVPLIPGGFTTLDVRSQVVLGAVAVMLTSVAALQLVTALPDGERGIARWRAGPWYLLWGALAFGLASVTWLGPQTGSATRVALPSVADALVVFDVSIVVWTLGYVAGAPAGLRAFARRGVDLLLRGTSPVVHPGAALPWVLYGIGSLARVVTVALTGGFGYIGDPSTPISHALAFGQLLNMLSTFALFAIAAAAYRAFSTATRGGLVTLVALVGIEAVVGALSGGKESFIVSVLAVLIPYGAVRGRVPLRLLLIGTLLFLWIIVPFNSAYRKVVRGEQSSLSPAAAVAAAPGVLSGVVQGGTPWDGLSGSATTVLYRVREIDNIAIILQMTPTTIAYRSPLDFAAAPVIGLVPRALWPDKPVLTPGYQFSQEYYGLPSSMYTSTAITPAGDLYRHGGWPVMVVGMLLLGLGFRLFDALFKPERDPRAVCFLLVFLPMLVKSEVDLVSLVASLPSGIVTAMLGARLMCFTRRPRSAKSPAAAGAPVAEGNATPVAAVAAGAAPGEVMA